MLHYFSSRVLTRFPCPSVGKNRGPAGLFAYLILHTNVPSLDEAFQMVKRHDTRNPRVVATSRNTFLEELKIMCAKVGKPANLPS